MSQKQRKGPGGSGTDQDIKKKAETSVTANQTLSDLDKAIRDAEAAKQRERQRQKERSGCCGCC